VVNENPTREEVQASIVPKSDQLNSDDLAYSGPITVTIEGVSRGDKEQPISVAISGRQPWKPCKSMRRVLIAVYTDDPKKWVGQQVTLFADPTVMWAGVKVGGIRISHMSGIEGPKTFLLTQTRGKKAEVVIQPIAATPEPTPEEQAYIDETVQSIAGVSTLEELQNLGAMMKDKSAAIRVALRGPYAARKEELK